MVGEEGEYKQLGTVNLRALFILDKLITRDTKKFQAAWAVAFPGLMCEPGQIQPHEVTRGPWLVILTRMGATREETTDILERVASVVGEDASDAALERRLAGRDRGRPSRVAGRASAQPGYHGGRREDVASSAMARSGSLEIPGR
jgi:hypothetical protein